MAGPDTRAVVVGGPGAHLREYDFVVALLQKERHALVHGEKLWQPAVHNISIGTRRTHARTHAHKTHDTHARTRHDTRHTKLLRWWVPEGETLDGGEDDVEEALGLVAGLGVELLEEEAVHLAARQVRQRCIFLILF
jgi:CBS-domain-containing membrane protein